MREIVSIRITVRDLKRNILARYNTYGALVNNRQIYTNEGYTFTAGRKSGFGKKNTIWSFENGNTREIIVDRIEKIAG